MRGFGVPVTSVNVAGGCIFIINYIKMRNSKLFENRIFIKTHLVYWRQKIREANYMNILR